MSYLGRPRTLLPQDGVCFTLRSCSKVSFLSESGSHPGSGRRGPQCVFGVTPGSRPPSERRPGALHRLLKAPRPSDSSSFWFPGAVWTNPGHIARILLLGNLQPRVSPSYKLYCIKTQRGMFCSCSGHRGAGFAALPGNTSPSVPLAASRPRARPSGSSFCVLGALGQSPLNFAGFVLCSPARAGYSGCLPWVASASSPTGLCSGPAGHTASPIPCRAQVKIPTVQAPPSSLQIRVPGLQTQGPPGTCVVSGSPRLPGPIPASQAGTPRLGAPRGLFAGVVCAGFLRAPLGYLLRGLTFGLKRGWNALPASRFQPNLFTFSTDPNSLNFLGDERPDGIGF